MERFDDRRQAGAALAERLRSLSLESPLVLGLPRGGVPVAAEVARELGGELDVCIVRKIGAPGYEELGVGAVAEGGAVFLNRELLARVGLLGAALEEAVEARVRDVEARAKALRGEGSRPPPVRGRTVILVDDGIATGGSMRAAVAALREQGPSRLVVAVPVAASQSLASLAPLVDDLVVLVDTPDLSAVGAWYDDFTQTRLEEVQGLLARARTTTTPAPRGASEGGGRGAQGRAVAVQVDGATLEGLLDIPSGARGLVLFAHGGGSSHHSPRNRQVATAFHRHDLATLRVSLLTAAERGRNGPERTDLLLHVKRLLGAYDWTRRPGSGCAGLAIGLFGSSTGAAAALAVAAARPEGISAIVSRGGRVDLAAAVLGRVRAPTLLLVGARDTAVRELNRQAAASLAAPHVLSIVPGANHLFEEPGALELVSEEAARWFLRHLEPMRPEAGTHDGS